MPKPKLCAFQKSVCRKVIYRSALSREAILQLAKPPYTKSIKLTMLAFCKILAKPKYRMLHVKKMVAAGCRELSR